jgi:hypothetical protein
VAARTGLLDRGCPGVRRKIFSVTPDERWLAAHFFADLAGTSDADEQAAIDSGLIQPNRIQYAGTRY